MTDGSAQEFETLVAKVLTENGYQLLENSTGEPRSIGYDFTMQHSDLVVLVEIKYYRTAEPQPSLLKAAALGLSAAVEEQQAEAALLIVSSELSRQLLRSLEERFRVSIFDRRDILTLAAANPELLESLMTLLEDGGDVSLRRTSRRLPSVNRRDRGAPASAPTTGAELCADLKELAAGTETWTDYENLCERIIKYLFSFDLRGWHRQIRTSDEISRFDYICRLRPHREFWRFLVDHLNSRYVLFEFKNYKKAIKQGQILTTEKYLLEKGLRRVAIIFTRLGCDDNASKMIAGAMRESGKLILVLNDSDVCEMLCMRDRGDDPSDFLFLKADDFLLKLSR